MIQLATSTSLLLNSCTCARQSASCGFRLKYKKVLLQYFVFLRFIQPSFACTFSYTYILCVDTWRKFFPKCKLSDVHWVSQYNCITYTCDIPRYWSSETIYLLKYYLTSIGGTVLQFHFPKSFSQHFYIGLNNSWNL